MRPVLEIGSHGAPRYDELKHPVGTSSTRRTQSRLRDPTTSLKAIDIWYNFNCGFMDKGILQTKKPWPREWPRLWKATSAPITSRRWHLSARWNPKPFRTS